MDPLLNWVASLPQTSIYVLLGMLAGLENIFPPVPADTVIALGAFLASQGYLSWPLVFLSTWIGTASMATTVYVVARHYGRPFFRGRIGQRLLSPHRLEAIERLDQRWGSWGILLSRLLPVWRAVVPPFAGLAHLSAWKTLPPLYAGSALWYGTLTYVVYRLGGTLEEGLRFVGRLNRGMMILAVALLGVALWLGWRSRRRHQRMNRHSNPPSGDR